MKTVETTLFSFSELSTEAQDRVLENKARDIESDPDNFTLHECIDSLKKIVAACGHRLSNWQIGPYCRGNYASVDHGDEWEGGHKATARFVRVLIEHGYARPKHFRDMEFPGICGFTGVCFDDDMAEEMLKAFLDGASLGQAADRAADRIKRICEEDLEYRSSREGILEYLDTEEEIYTETGELF